MSIHVNIPQFLQHLAGDTVVFETHGSTVGECLTELNKSFPQLKTWLFNSNGQLSEKLSVFVNGENSQPEVLPKPVKDGDILNIVYLIVGG